MLFVFNKQLVTDYSNTSQIAIETNILTKIINGANTKHYILLMLLAYLD